MGDLGLAFWQRPTWWQVVLGGAHCMVPKGGWTLVHWLQVSSQITMVGNKEARWEEPFELGRGWS